MDRTDGVLAHSTPPSSVISARILLASRPGAPWIRGWQLTRLRSTTIAHGLASASFGWKGQLPLLDVSRGKLTRLLSYVGFFLVFPLLTSLLVGVIGHSAILGVKTFLLIELGMAILSPLFGAVATSGVRKPHHHREK